MNLIQEFYALRNKAVKNITATVKAANQPFVFFVDEDVEERWDVIESECQSFTYINKYNESDTYYIQSLYLDEDGIQVRGVERENNDEITQGIAEIDTEALIHLADLIDGRSPDDFNGLPPSPEEEEEAEADEVGEL